MDRGNDEMLMELRSEFPPGSQPQQSAVCPIVGPGQKLWFALRLRLLGAQVVFDLEASHYEYKRQATYNLGKMEIACTIFQFRGLFACSSSFHR